MQVFHLIFFFLSLKYFQLVLFCSPFIHTTIPLFLSLSITSLLARSLSLPCSLHLHLFVAHCPDAVFMVKTHEVVI